MEAALPIVSATGLTKHFPAGGGLPFVRPAAQVRAVGTEFDVYRHGSETRVTVLEGIVAVQPVLMKPRATGLPASPRACG